jgi:hypothetical protein
VSSASSKTLRELLQRVESWPEHAQQEALDCLLSIEQELADPYVLTDEDRNAIDRGLDDMRRGQLASGEQIEAAFRRSRGDK